MLVDVAGAAIIAVIPVTAFVLSVMIMIRNQFKFIDLRKEVRDMCLCA